MSTIVQDGRGILAEAMANTALLMNNVFVGHLQEEIKKKVKGEGNVVYSGYKPMSYKRRYDGGIAAFEYNVLIKEAYPSPDGLSIIMANTAPGTQWYETLDGGGIMIHPGDGGGIPADAVEHGGPWNVTSKRVPPPPPRPFMQKAADEWIESGAPEEYIQGILDAIK